MVWAFRLAAAGAMLAVAIHVAALAIPAFAASSYPGYPVWRHVVFVAIDSAVAWLFLRRPTWFIWAYAVLTVQVLYSHGGSAWSSWQQAGRVSWIDAAALVAIPLALVLLLIDHRSKKRRGVDGPPVVVL